MNIMLGNLSAEEISKRSGVVFNDIDKKWLESNRCQKTKLKEGTWHCYDIPFMIVCENKNLAEEIRDRLGVYDWSKCKEALQISWERAEQ